MACCIFAAFLMVQCGLILRRWGRFWCILPVDECSNETTVLDIVRAWLRKPIVKIIILTLIAAEAVALGLWVSADHSDHFALSGWGLFEKENQQLIVHTTDGGAFVYTQLCNSRGETRQILTSLY